MSDFRNVLLLFACIIGMIGCDKSELEWTPAPFEVFDASQLGRSDKEVIKHRQMLCVQSNEKYSVLFHKDSNIDFSEKTLLLGYTPTFSGIANIEQAFYSNSDNQYRYRIIIYTLITSEIDSAIYGIIVDKLDEEKLEYAISIKAARL